MKKYRVKEGSPLEFAVFMTTVITIMAACIWAASGTYLGM